MPNRQAKSGGDRSKAPYDLLQASENRLSYGGWTKVTLTQRPFTIKSGGPEIDPWYLVMKDSGRPSTGSIGPLEMRTIGEAESTKSSGRRRDDPAVVHAVLAEPQRPARA